MKFIDRILPMSRAQVREIRAVMEEHSELMRFPTEGRRDIAELGSREPGQVFVRVTDFPGRRIGLAGLFDWLSGRPKGDPTNPKLSVYAQFITPDIRVQYTRLAYNTREAANAFLALFDQAGSGRGQQAVTEESSTTA